MDKSTLRAQMRRQRREMTEAQTASQSERLCRMFLQSELYRDAAAIYGYLPFGGEVRILPILAQALRDGKRVAVPKVCGDEMRFILISELAQTAPGYRGIPEPIADAPIACDGDATVLVPGLAFTRDGKRLGYGGGFYDRFLSREPGHPTVALCYGFQLLDNLPADAWDVAVDRVIVPQEVFE